MGVRLLAHRATLAASLAVPAGCFFPADSVCTAEARPSIGVTLRDAATGRTLPVASRVTAVGAQHRGSLDVPPNTDRVSFDEGFVGPDTYVVTVRAAGYRDWSQAGVRVRGGRCHVESPALVTASLARVFP